MRERTTEEAAWSEAAINVCWTAGCKRPEVVGAVQQVDNEKNGRCHQRLLHQDSDERGEAPLGQKTEGRGGVGDQKPRTSDEALQAKKR